MALPEGYFTPINWRIFSPYKNPFFSRENITPPPPLKAIGNEAWG